MRGEGGVAGSQPMCIQLYTVDQINFEVPTPNLTYENTNTKNKKVILFGSWVFEE
jgi:hypothetical protein